MLGKKVVVSSVFFILMLALALIFRPFPQASTTNIQRTFGTIEKVFETGSNGIVFKLKGDDRLFYIDRDANVEHEIDILPADLQGQHAEILYVKQWAPIGLMSNHKQIAKMAINKTTLFSAYK